MDIEPLLEGANQLGLDLSDKQLKQVEDYARELKKWSKAINLTTIKHDRDIIIRHFLDCFAVYPYIKGESLIDVGSGAGFPGMALSILFPQKKIYCVDTVAKKIHFLTHIKAKLKSEQVYPLHKRIEALTEIQPEQMISRAFSALDTFFDLSTQANFSKSQFLAMKGKQAEAEIAQSKYKKSVTIKRLNVPFLQAERFLLIKTAAIYSASNTLEAVRC